MSTEKQANRFTEEDRQRYIEALNFIATEAKFGESAPDITYMIKSRNHFAFLQSLVGKIHDNIFEVKAVHTPEKPKSKAKSKASK